MSNRTQAKTDLDDWDTDPDYVRDMDEMTQRWGGTNRTVGSINMGQLIDDVRREHKALRDKFQASTKSDFVNKSSFVESTADSKDHVKHSTNEIRREFITSETSSYIKKSNGSVLDEYVRDPISPTAPRTITKTTTTTTTSNRNQTQANPPLAPKPGDLKRIFCSTEPKRPDYSDTVVVTDPPKQFKKDYISTKKIFEEKSTSSGVTKSPTDRSSPPPAIKSIQSKIDAFKKEFDNIEKNLSKKSDLPKVIKKTTNVERKSDNVQYVTRSNEKINSGDFRATSAKQPSYDSDRPTSASPLHRNVETTPKTSIKSLSQKFESLGRETSDDFRRRMDERRQEFFDRIKTQVRETRKGLDGFDIDDSDDEVDRARFGRTGAKSSSPMGTKLTSPIYGSQSTFRSNDSLGSSRPKVYSRRETTQEEVVSRVVKENDKIVHDETKRNVEHTSSNHGSSDEEADDPQPSSIKFINRELRSSPHQRTQSPIDEIRRKIPLVEPQAKGAGLMARTLYDYQAAEDDELTFDVDELITNIEKIDQGWYKGMITRGDIKRVGLFPANYVKLLNDSDAY